MSPLDELQKKYNCLDVVNVVQRGDLIVLEVQNASATAEILLQGAQLISYKKSQDADPIIWRSKEIFYKDSTPIRGGMPIIAPWFGDATSNPQSVQDLIDDKNTLPAHGFARTSKWMLEEILEISQNQTRIVLCLDEKQTSLQPWKVPFRLQMIYLIGEEISVTMKVTNQSTKEMTLALALHTYFAISHVSDVHIPSFDGLSYYDNLTSTGQNMWEGGVIIDREIDVTFQKVPPKQEIIDEGWQRKIILETKGSTSAVLWNPWINKAKKLSMFGDEEYKEMVCIETANVRDDVKTLAAGSSHSIDLKIHSEPLSQ